MQKHTIERKATDSDADSEGEHDIPMSHLTLGIWSHTSSTWPEMDSLMISRALKAASRTASLRDLFAENKWSTDPVTSTRVGVERGERGGESGRANPRPLYVCMYVFTIRSNPHVAWRLLLRVWVRYLHAGAETSRTMTQHTAKEHYMKKLRFLAFTKSTNIYKAYIYYWHEFWYHEAGEDSCYFARFAVGAGLPAHRWRSGFRRHFGREGWTPRSPGSWAR